MIAVFGCPQVGKTNFLCRLAEELVRTGCPVLFYPALSLAAGLLREVAEDFGWILGEPNPTAVLVSRLGQVLRRTRSRLVLIIDGWNEAELSAARAIDRECERLCSGSPDVQLVVSFTHSAANRLLVQAGDPSFVAGATGIGVRGHEIVELDPAAAGNQAGWSAVVIEPYDRDEQTASYRSLRAHYEVRVPDSHRRTADPFLLGVAMRHFAGRTLPDAMDEPGLLGAWLGARIGRIAVDGFDVRAALTELGRVMVLGGGPVAEAEAKRCWGLSPVAVLPPPLSEAALLATIGDGTGRFVDFYNSRDRDYVIACWAGRWPARLAAGEFLWDELAAAACSRVGADAVRWFFSQPAFVTSIVTSDGALPDIRDVQLRRVFLAAIRHLTRAAHRPTSGVTAPRSELDTIAYHAKWAAQCVEWAKTDPDLKCRVEATKLLVEVTDEEDDILDIIPSGESQREFVRGLLEVHEEYALEAEGLGQLVLETFRKIHLGYASDHEEEYSPLTFVLKGECNNPSRSIRAAALASLGDLMPRTFLEELAAGVPGRLVPEDYLWGTRNAVSRITETYYGIGYCKSYLSYLEDDHAHDQARGHYLDEHKLLAAISRFTNISDAKGEFRELLGQLADLLPESCRAELPPPLTQDAPGQQYLFDQ